MTIAQRQERHEKALTCGNWYRRGLAIRYGFLSKAQQERALIDPHPQVRALTVSMGGLSAAQHLRALADSDWRVRQEANLWSTP